MRGEGGGGYTTHKNLPLFPLSMCIFNMLSASSNKNPVTCVSLATRAARFRGGTLRVPSPRSAVRVCFCCIIGT